MAPVHISSASFATSAVRRSSSISRLRLATARILLAAALPASLAAAWAAPAVCRAESTDAAPDVENAKHSSEGQVINTAYVRSGPSDDFYPTQRLEKGAIVVVVGKKGNWLKIQPPEGSFSYVQKAFVNKYGTGSTGKVTAQQLNVRAGSILQPQMQGAVQTKLEAGQDVTIVGEYNEYFKIRPPESAYLYIKADEVTPVRVLAKAGEHPADPPALTQDPTGGVPSPQGTQAPKARAEGSSTAVLPLPRPAQPAGEVPTTGPSGLETVTRLQKLETDFAAASNLPLAEQPIDALLAGYESLATSPGVPEPTRQMADARADTLKARAEARDQFVAFQKQREEEEQKMQAQVAERQEIEERIKKIDIQVYAAVGTLRPSSLQVGTGPAAGRATLYRLTDPATGRTLVYLRSADPRYAELVGQFIGVKGDIGADAQLNSKVIVPSVTEAVDPANVNGSVAAEIIPPSLAAKTPTASVGGDQR